MAEVGVVVVIVISYNIIGMEVLDQTAMKSNTCITLMYVKPQLCEIQSLKKMKAY